MEIKAISEKEWHQIHCHEGQAPKKNLQSGQEKLKERVYENIACHIPQSTSSEGHIIMNWIRHCQLLLFLRHSIRHILLDNVLQNDLTWFTGIHGTSTRKFRNTIWAFSTCLSYQTPKDDCQSLLKVGPMSSSWECRKFGLVFTVRAMWGKLHSNCFRTVLSYKPQTGSILVASNCTTELQTYWRLMA